VCDIAGLYVGAGNLGKLPTPLETTDTPVCRPENGLSASWWSIVG